MIRIGCEPNASWELNREWLETDGRGGYASSTLADCHTRRYHGLLVTNLPDPEGRHVLLSKLEDSFQAEGEEVFFSGHRYPGVFFPPGPPPLREFFLGLFPRFHYRSGRQEVQKSILLIRDGATLLIRYELLGAPGNGLLRLKPFLAFRGVHRLARENAHLCARTEEIAQGLRIEPYAGMPPLFLRTSAPCRFLSTPLWYRRFEYTEERERGFDWHEDLFLPGVLEVPLSPGKAVILSASCETPDEEAEKQEEQWAAEIARRRGERHRDKTLITPLFAKASPSSSGHGTAGAPAASPFDAPQAGHQGRQGGTEGDHPPTEDPEVQDREILLTLLEAGRKFLIRTPSGRPAVIAGYHWFGSWGRDSLISLPGLAFCCGRIDTGVEILAEMGRHEQEGLLPNFFSADGNPEAYNTVDSSLLYFRAVQELLRITGDAELIREKFWPVMKRIIACFREGTRYGIGMDGRGLLHAGDGKDALTWMDAMVGGTPVTPRDGYAVEINALWYNALCLSRDLAARFADPDAPPDDLLDSLRRSFRETFWIPEGGYLGDVYRNGVLDKAVRPNQLLAVSLPFSPLDAAQQALVVRTVRKQLLTPCGLRTLSPADPAYRGLYRGNGPERDAAYHQGTVWPWLWGPFGEATLRVAKDKEKEKKALRRQLRTFLGSHLREAGIGSVSEVFDGDAPHRPGGCIAQAWSVAELIRLYMLLGDLS